MFAPSHQAQLKSPEELNLSLFVELLSAAQLDGTPQARPEPQEQHLSLPKMLSLWPPGSTRCKFPCMSLRSSVSTKSNGVPLKDMASAKMALPLTATPEDIHTVPSKLLSSLCTSLMTLVNSRLRSSACALLQKARSMDDCKSKEMIMLTSMLVPHQRSRRQSVVITSAITSFRSLLNATHINADLARSTNSRTSKEVILPLIFEAVINLKLLGTFDTTVSVHAPGSVSGVFSPMMPSLLSHVDISIETTALLDSLMECARRIVKQTVATAAGLVQWEMLSSEKIQNSLERREHEEETFRCNLSYTSTKEDKESETSQNSDSSEEIPLPRRISELAEFQAEHPSGMGRNHSLLLDLNALSNSSDEFGVPSIRIGDLFNILQKEHSQISEHDQNTSSTTSTVKRKSNLLSDRTSPNNNSSKPLKKRVSFSMRPYV